MNLKLLKWRPKRRPKMNPREGVKKLLSWIHANKDVYEGSDSCCWGGEENEAIHECCSEGVVARWR
ncbi:MAG: hypothetical protein MW690_000584 [Methanophagales archaeon]|nr:hypothetical protein [Methanophagales archaeon]